MNILTQEEKEAVMEAIYAADLSDATLYEGYSGRAMYGAETFGIVGTIQELMLVLIELAADGHDELARDLNRAQRQDSMGPEAIFYFPGHNLPEEEEEEPSMGHDGLPAQRPRVPRSSGEY